MNGQPSRRHRIYVVLASAVAALLPACTTDGHFDVLGYTTKPNYSTRYRTVRIPIFKNNTHYKGLEFDLTKEVVRSIESRTPYKVVGPDDPADTELLGRIVEARKNILLRNQQNTVREAQTLMRVELVWRDLETGEILSSPRTGPEAPAINQQLTAPQILAPAPLPGTSADPEPGKVPIVEAVPAIAPKLPAVLIQSFGSFIPELGGSISTSFQKNVQTMAVRITEVMEKGW